MRIAITTVQVPFVKGGAEMFASGLARALRTAGHHVEVITTPFRFAPPAEVLRNMEFWQHENFQRFDCGAIDRVVCLKFPTYYLSHPNKIVWLAHQHRAAYELLNTPHGLLESAPREAALRSSIVERDTHHLQQASSILTISKRVSERLLRYNGLSSESLYHPPPYADRYYCGEQLSYVYFPSRLEDLKRQELLIRAMLHVRSPVAAIMSGTGGAHSMLGRLIEHLNLQSRVRLIGHISAAEMAGWYANALAIFYGPFDEDYGYVTLEAMLAAKPVITCIDSGGPLEFVANEETGLIVDPSPEAVAGAIDNLCAHRRQAAEMGYAGRNRYRSLGIAWTSVVENLVGRQTPTSPTRDDPVALV
jgi:glycosyltransferase involved in cell wall biosynthesis